MATIVCRMSDLLMLRYSHVKFDNETPVKWSRDDRHGFPPTGYTSTRSPWELKGKIENFLGVMNGKMKEGLGSFFRMITFNTCPRSL